MISFDNANNENKIQLIKILLLRELNALEAEFSDYLTTITTNNANYSHKAEFLFNNLFEDDISGSELGDDTKINIALLTFNYMQPNFQDPIFKSETYYSRNVHGNINDRNIIMGIDYESDGEKHSLVRFTKTYRTLAFTNIQRSHNLFDYPLDKVKIYGHSLNIADQSYFYAIFDAVKLYS
ncbi:hypothetical protein DSM07_03435 [Oenococcus sp. UCMA 16435]|nr:hypothetical protein DSM07_03435 [Oenococcus sp. UCMA 16435]